MKKITFLTFCFWGISSVFGQTISFEKILPLSPEPANVADMTGVQNSSIAFSDIDGDNDKDLLITGTSIIGSITQMYKNDGSGNFSFVNGMSFPGVTAGSVAFSDVDNDLDQDVLITGNNAGVPIAQLYKNDGTGNFSLVAGTPFTGVTNSSVMFSDIDNDGDEDVLIAGENVSVQLTELFINDGSGNFSLVNGTPFTGVSHCSVKFADVDGDVDKDVLVSGVGNNIRSSKLYLNNGSGSFVLMNGTPFVGVSYAAIKFADIDGDTDQDVIIMGLSDAGNSTKLYKNDGSGNFSLSLSAPFENISFGDLGFSDIEGDGDQDVLISGSGMDHTVKLYKNNGLGDFSLVNTPQFEANSFGSIAFEDVDSDGDSDVLLTGGGVHARTQLYMNNGAGNFVFAGQSAIKGVKSGSLALSDIDNDGDNDVLVTGYRDIARSELYTNNGAGNFSLVNNSPFDGVSYGGVAFSDIDNDNDEDLLITGGTISASIAKLYENDGLGNFSLISSPFTGVDQSSVDFADIDNDGDQDVLITGSIGSFTPIAQLFKNDGFGNFSLVSNTPFEAVLLSSTEFSDIDNDNDLDVLIAGWNSQPITKLYTNDGSGNFTLVNGTPFIGINSGSLAFNDIDNDGDNDVLLSGATSSGSVTALYSNDGSGNFSLVNNTPFQELSYGTISFSDADGDNDDDLLITGMANPAPIAKLYTNDGTGNYTLSNSFIGMWSSSAAFGNLDDDADPDIVMTGLGFCGGIARVYRNTTCFPQNWTDTQIACDSYIWIDGNTYIASNDSATYTFTNQAGCSSTATLNLTIVPSIPLKSNTFSMPSDVNDCVGSVAITLLGMPDFTCSIDGDTPFVHSGYHLEQNLCGGTHELTVTDGCGNTTNSIFVIPIDTNFVFNNPFIDSIAVDSLGSTIENCDIDYNSIDTAFIDSIWTNANTVTVIWNVIDSNGPEYDTSFYELNNGNGVYYLQLTVFCPTKSLGEYFGVTEAIFFNDGSISTASLPNTDETWFDIHPNPTNEEVSVHFENKYAWLRITDALGILISNDEISSGSVVSLADKPSGVYLFQLISEKGGTVKRVVKN